MKIIQRLVMLCQIQWALWKAVRLQRKLAIQVRRSGCLSGPTIEALRVVSDQIALDKEHKQLLVKHLFAL